MSGAVRWGGGTLGDLMIKTVLKGEVTKGIIENLGEGSGELKNFCDILNEPGGEDKTSRAAQTVGHCFLGGENGRHVKRSGKPSYYQKHACGQEDSSCSTSIGTVRHRRGKRGLNNGKNRILCGGTLFRSRAIWDGGSKNPRKSQKKKNRRRRETRPNASSSKSSRSEGLKKPTYESREKTETSQRG